MKKKLYIVTIGEHSFYFGGYSLSDVGEKYPNANKIEFVADKLVLNEGDRYFLLKEAYEFIREGANTHSNEQRIILEEKINKHLNG